MGGFKGGINQAGSSGSFSYTVQTGFEKKPVHHVSFWDAARFANWLTTGDTETGVYELGGVTQPDNSTISRNATEWSGGGVAVASRDEWVKAAYYDPTLNSGSGGYWSYPTQSNSVPTATTPNGTNPNSANHSNAAILIRIPRPGLSFASRMAFLNLLRRPLIPLHLTLHQSVLCLAEEEGRSLRCTFREGFGT